VLIQRLPVEHRISQDNRLRSGFQAIAAEVVSHYLIGFKHMATMYVSPTGYCGTFEEELNLQKFDFTTHWMAGLCFFEKDSCLILASIDLGTPGA
jgi:hypothetical protein